MILRSQFLFSNYLHEFLVMEIHVGNILRNGVLFAILFLLLKLLPGGLIIPIDTCTRNHVLKTHIVFGKSPGFIGKYMLNLTQLLVESTSLHSDLRRWSGNKWRVTDIDSLNVFHHF